MKKILLTEIFLNESYNNIPYISGDHIMILKFYELLKDKYDINIMASLKSFIEYAKSKGVNIIPVSKENIDTCIESTQDYDILINNNSVFSIHHPNKIHWVHSDYFKFFTKDEVDVFLKEVKQDFVKWVVFVSEPLRDNFKVYVDDKKSLIIPNFTEYIAPYPKSYQEPIKVVWVGRLESNKNWQVLLKAMKHEPIQTYFIGDGPELGILLEMKSTKPNAYKNMHFLGYMPNEDILNFHKNETSIFVFTSKEESFGLSLLEAISYGLPVISIDTYVSRYIMGDKGLYFKNEVELKNLIFKLKADKTFYEEQVHHSLERAKLFYKDHIKEMWDSILLN